MMDEKTELLAVRVPVDVGDWLRSVAAARGWRMARALRWAVKETMEREQAKAAAPSRGKDLQALL